jgi:hypothetical protein
MSTISHWRVWCDTDSKWEHWYLPSTDGEPTKCPVDTAHLIDSIKTAKFQDDVQNTGRTSVDGALVVKQDPGTPDTDPKFYPHSFAVPTTSGVHWFDLSIPQNGTSRMQYLAIQVRGPVLGDRVDVVFRADNSGTTGAPENTVLADFGGIHPSMHLDSAGWSVERREPRDQGSAKLVPAGVKVSIRYNAADAAGRDLIVDACCHE